MAGAMVWLLARDLKFVSKHELLLVFVMTFIISCLLLLNYIAGLHILFFSELGRVKVSSIVKLYGKVIVRMKDQCLRFMVCH